MDTKEQAAFFPATVMPDPDWWQALWPDPEGVIRALGVRPGMTVLDLCLSPHEQVVVKKGANKLTTILRFEDLLSP